MISTVLEKREIAICKSKSVLALTVSILIIALGFWLISLDSSSILKNTKYSALFVYILGGVIFLAGIYVLYVTSLRLFIKKTPGLVVDAEGIIVDTNGFSTEVIPWSKIESIREYSLTGNKFVSIHTSDPFGYLKNLGFITKITLKSQEKSCGTPISFSAAGLQVTHDELVLLLGRYFSESRENV